MKKALVFISALFLTACAQKLVPNAEPTVKPCIIPTSYSSNSMGQLGIQVVQIANTYRIIIPTDNVFDPRSADIKDSAYPGLSLLANYLKRFPSTKMAVTGYTDSLGSYPEDQSISEKQARSLITYLWTQSVPHECLTPIGIGKDAKYTIASNRSVDGSVANRRIEITFTAKTYGSR